MSLKLFVGCEDAIPGLWWLPYLVFLPEKSFKHHETPSIKGGSDTLYKGQAMNVFT
jgi:hypothetical protein